MTCDGPLTMTLGEGQVSFCLQVGGLTTAILLDSDDHHMKKRLRKRRDMSGRTDDAPQAVTNRLTYYKHHTLPVIGYLDGIQQLIVVSGQHVT